MLDIFNIDDFVLQYGEPIKVGAIIYVILIILGQWKVFEKAGIAGWKSLIPFYNICKLLQIAGKSWAGIFVFCLLCIPILGWIIVFFYYLSIINGLSKHFGHGFLFTLGLLFFFPIFLIILGLEDSTYQA